ncbi:MAG: FAD-dependent oxidoreductase [Actinobacteria bacterium]|nr:FAD-dependent oxidoreductase [Actinomycetota bacterium]
MPRVAVVGAGVMGCAAAWALADAGAEVTLHEQFELDHTRGSSHGRSRIVRYAYHDPYWIPLAREARDAWRELEAESGETLLELLGLVELAPSRELGSAPALEQAGVEFEVGPVEGIVAPDGWTTLREPSGGVIHADRARLVLLDAARSRGAEVVLGSRVASADDLDADAVVVTAGSWVRDFAPDLPVRVTRETVTYFRHDGPPLPSIVEVSPETGLHQMYALHDPVHGLKAGVHHGGAEVDPDDEGGPDPEIAARTVAWVRERLPGVDPEPLGSETCLYTTTPDERFVLERRGRVVIGSACSGHGFKFAPAVGRRLAELALA